MTTSASTFGFSSNLALLICLVTLCCFMLWLSEANDTLRPGENLTNTETLVSSNGAFELGFFSSGGASSSNYYLGIWFRNDPNKKPVWVASREIPIIGSNGVLFIRYDGNLVITDRRLVPIIVNSGMLTTSSNTSAILLDSGNLILRGVHGIVWQSFYNPSDTFLPGMRLGWSKIVKNDTNSQFLVSWQSPEDPASGSFSFGLDSSNKTLLKVWHRDDISRDIGFWDGKRFKFLIQVTGDYNFSYVSNANDTYLTFNTRDIYNSSWFVMSFTGRIQEYKMIGKQIQMLNHSACLNSAADSGADCYVVEGSKCPNGHNFSQIQGLMPKSVIISESAHFGLIDCEIICRSNCSCTAFASFRSDGTGCEFYYGDRDVVLNNMEIGNDTIYIRGDMLKTSEKKKRKLVLIIIPVLIVSLAALVLLILCRCRGHQWFKASYWTQDENLDLFLLQIGKNNTEDGEVRSKRKFSGRKDHELPLLSFACIAASTNYFSIQNKIGEGGFGPVYKGTLLGHEIAVKRLSTMSGQGLEEFKNEVRLISRIQHRNLVRLLACCVENDEKILVYEYMSNKSLDSFLFDPTRQILLDWKQRFSVIEGIAQGLLYLHKYSRLRIIHRDLKTSNILMDDQMNPRISDFGMARTFGDDETRTRTTRVVGTFGYMSPEYTTHGFFSIKSDVYSFGVIVLEIVSGRKNVTFSRIGHTWNLLGYAWDLWKDDRISELMDPTLASSVSMSECMLCIQLGLLCVQERPEDRPTMSDVISMLGNESMNLPIPKEPAFWTHLNSSSSSTQPFSSQNNVTFSGIAAR